MNKESSNNSVDQDAIDALNNAVIGLQDMSVGVDVLRRDFVNSMKARGVERKRIYDMMDKALPFGENEYIYNDKNERVRSADFNEKEYRTKQLESIFTAVPESRKFKQYAERYKEFIYRQRIARGDYKQEDAGLIEGFAKGIAQGTLNVGRGLSSTVEEVGGLIGDNPIGNAIKSTGENSRSFYDDFAKENQQLNLNESQSGAFSSAVGFMHAAGSGIATSAPAIIAGTVTGGGAIPAMFAAGGSYVATQFGDDYKDMKKRVSKLGYSDNEILGLTVLNTTIGATAEATLGNVPMGGKILKRALSKNVIPDAIKKYGKNKVMKTLNVAGIEILKNAAEESGTEVIQYASPELIAQLAGDSESGIIWKDLINAGVEAIPAAVMFGGVSGIQNVRSQSKRVNALNAINRNPDTHKIYINALRRQKEEPSDHKIMGDALEKIAKMLKNKPAPIVPPINVAQPMAIDEKEYGVTDKIKKHFRNIDVQKVPEGLIHGLNAGVEHEVGEDEILIVEPISSSTTTLSGIAKELTGAAPIFYLPKTQNADTINGMLDDDKMYINVNKFSDNPLVTFGHEFGHALKRKAPDLWNTFHDVLMDDLDNNIKKYAKQKFNTTDVNDEIVEEMVSGAYGDLFADPQFMRSVIERAESKQSGFGQRFVKVINKFILYLKQRIKGNLGALKYIRNLEKVRDIAVETVAEFHKRNHSAIILKTKESTGVIPKTEKTTHTFYAETPDGKYKINGQWKVIDIDDVITSDDGAYDKALQPRNRDTQSSQEQISQIANNINPDLLMESPTTDMGSPIVDKRGQVISGNGRTMGLKLADKNGKAQDYYHRVREYADKNKIEISKNIKKPLLVREVGDVITAGNHDFLNGFVQAVGDQSLIHSDGSFSSALKTRVRRGVLAALFDGSPNARENVRNLIEKGANIGMKRQLDDVMAPAGRLLKLAKFRKEVLNGKLKRGDVELYLDQGNIFGEGLSPEGKILFKNIANGRSVNQTRDYLNEGTRVAEGVNLDTVDMFDGKPMSKLQIFNNTEHEANEKNSLNFDEKEIPNDTSPTMDMERSSEVRNVEHKRDEEALRDDRRRNGTGTRSRTAETDGKGLRKQGDFNLSPDASELAGAGGDSVDGGSVSRDRTGAADHSGMAGSSQNRDGRVQQQSNTKRVRRRQTPANTDKSARKEKSEQLSIEEALPQLYREQQEDVAKAEKRYESNGKGMLFTNATGTGKTFTGLGIVKRFINAGKNNVLIVTPTSEKNNDWINDAKKLDIGVILLSSITDNGGESPCVTTYANFRQNESLLKRNWDLLVFDESHKISAASGDVDTQVKNALDRLSGVMDNAHFRAIGESLPEIKNALVKMDRDWSKYELEETEGSHAPVLQPGQISEGLLEKLPTSLQQKINNREAELSKSKVLFLSATPFSYHRSLIYANGYLFDFAKERGSGYNESNGMEKFFVENFGYRMRYNKLTIPENSVDIGLLERAFYEKLRKTGAVSGRLLDIDMDYSREFFTVNSFLGDKIQDGLNILMDASIYPNIHIGLNKKFNYHYVTSLLECLKAKACIDEINKNLRLGRKVVVFHNRNKGTPSHPFKLNVDDLWTKGVDMNNLRKEIKHFESTYPQLCNMPLGDLLNPIDLYGRVFRDKIVFFNGAVPQKERSSNIKMFNNEKSGIDIILIQTEAGKEGISLHDKIGTKQRVLINLGLPTKPTDLIQTEGRIYRLGSKSNAIFRYPVTGLPMERWAFGSKINQRASTAENLGMGEKARDLRDSLREGYMDASELEPNKNQGTGGKQSDHGFNSIDDFTRAKSYYFAHQKRTSKNKSRDGIDYYATPEPLGLKMVEWANIIPGDSVLEPSAGHGAIARFFPETVSAKAIELSNELASRLAVNTSAEVITGSFENHNVINKYDAIVMNPPFGIGGKTAIEHLDRAFEKHLKMFGRIVAIIPEGSLTERRFDKWMEMTDNTHLTAEIGLPYVTFERAGTSVKTRIVVIDKVPDHALYRIPKAKQRIDLNAENVNDLFDKIKEISVPGRERNKYSLRAYHGSSAGSLTRFSQKSIDGVEYVIPDGVEKIKTESGRKAFINDTNRVLNECRQFADALEKKGLSSDELHVCTTPIVIQRIGAKHLPIIISRGVINKVTSQKHHLSVEQLKLLPAALNQPIMVFDSKTNPDTLVMLTEIKEGKDNVVIALKLNQKNNDFYDVNMITSLYGKERPQDTIQGWINQNLLRYVHKKRVSSWIRQAGLQLSGVFHFRNSTYTIVDNSAFVKLEKWESLKKGAELRFDDENKGTFSAKRLQKNPISDDTARAGYQQAIDNYRMKRQSVEDIEIQANEFIQKMGGVPSVIKMFVDGDIQGHSNAKMVAVMQKILNSPEYHNMVLKDDETAKLLGEKYLSGMRSVLENKSLESRSEVGRALRMMREMMSPADTNGFKAFIDSMVSDLPKEKRDAVIDKMKEEYDIDLDDLDDSDFEPLPDPKAEAARKKKLADLIRHLSGMTSRIGDKIYEYWINSILSALSTHMSNIIGNTVNMTVELIPQRIVEAAINSVTKRPDGATFRDFKIMWNALDMRSAWARAGDTFKYEIFNHEGKIEHSSMSIGGKAGRVIRIPGRLLRAADEFAKGMIIPMEAAVFAEHTGSVKGFRGSKLKAYVLSQLSDKESAAYLYGHNRALELTYQQVINDGLAGSVVNGLMKMRQKGGIGGWIARFMLPFIKTPYNLIKTGVRKSPVGVLGVLKDTADVMHGKKLFGDKEIKHVAEQVLAWGALMALAATYDEDDPWITGTATEYGTAENKFKAEKSPPFSIKLGGRWYSYSRIEPITTGLAMMADALKGYHEAKNGKDLSKVILKFLSNSGKQLITDKTFLDGLGQITKTMEDPERFIPNNVGNFISSWIPNAVRKTVDAYHDNVLDYKIRDKGATWSQNFFKLVTDKAGFTHPEPKLDYFGRDIIKSEPITPVLWRLIIPSITKPADNMNATEKVIWAYNKRNPDAPYYPNVFAPTTTRNGIKYYLNNKAYTIYVKAVGKKFMKDCESAIACGKINRRNPTENDVQQIKSIRDAAVKKGWVTAIKKGLAKPY